MRPEADDSGELMVMTGETVPARLFANAATRQRGEVGGGTGSAASSFRVAYRIVIPDPIRAPYELL